MCLLLASMPHAFAADTYHYSVLVPEDLQSLTVEACFGEARPGRLVSDDDSAGDYLQDVFIHSGQTLQRLTPDPRGIELPAMKHDDCVQYTVRTSGQSTHPWFRGRQSLRQQVLLEIQRWLWLPASFNSNDQELHITFHLPPGMVVSAPWQRLQQDTDTVTYRFGKRPASWTGRVAIGHFFSVQRQIGNSQITIAIMNGHPVTDKHALLKWANTMLDALMLAYGEFPVPRLQLLLVPVGHNREVVPWGQAMRGGGDAVHVYIDQTRPMDDFLDDWVLIHELSHLLHPRIDGEGAWLYEGLASYYQNVLLARVGLLSHDEAWAELQAGFQRGMRGTPAHRSLADVTETMMRDHTYMRVYWSGAAISLLADTELRNNSQGRQSLDTALAGLHRCCLPSRRWWSAEEVMQQLDEVTNTRVFTRLYDAHVYSDRFPDVSTAYQDLGIHVQQGRLRFETQTPGSIHRLIMQAAAPGKY